MDTGYRYILFMIDSKIKEHDGMIFRSYNEAKEYLNDAINDKYCDKGVIAFFELNSKAERMNLSFVETFGFKGDKKITSQFNLFRPR